MKRVIRSSMERKKFKIFAGVTIGEDDNIDFNWTSDSSDDVVSLAEDTSGQFDSDGVRFVYGYEYAPNATGKDKKLFRTFLKTLPRTSDGLYSENIDEFVERAVLRLDERYSLQSFGATVHIESSTQPSLVDVMRGFLWEYLKNADIDFELVKEAYENVKFDSEKALQALIDAGYSTGRAEKQVERVLSRFEQFKEEGKLFQMKSFLPREIRGAFTDFLKFKTEHERKTYEALQGVNVLIFDDFMTSGTTVKEVIRYLRAIHDENTLTVFVLIKQ